MKFTDIKKNIFFWSHFHGMKLLVIVFLELIIFITTPLKLNYID